MPVRDAGACGYNVQESLRPQNVRCFEQRENYSINKIPKQVFNNSKGLLLARDYVGIGEVAGGFEGLTFLVKQNAGLAS